jgi:hypothetical protein
LGGWLAVLAGAWFATGPELSRLWEHGAGRAGPIGAPLFGNTRQALELIGYFYGLGALIIALAAFAVGRFASRPALAEPGEAEAVPSGGIVETQARFGGRWRRRAGTASSRGSSRVPAGEPYDGPESPLSTP